MGFRIVILGAVESVVAQFLLRKSDDFPWEISVCGQDFTAESEASVESFFQSKKPSIVVSLMTEPGDHSPVSSLKNIAAVCGRETIPLIHQSSYWAISPEDAKAEVLESVLAQYHPGNHEYASFESMAADVEKHIILRSSWLLDGDGAGLFATLLPPLLNADADVVVSDHDFGAPISCEHISDVIIALIQQVLTGAENWGIYHLKSADSCSEAEFCDHLIRQVQKELHVEIAFPTVASQDDERRFLSMNANLIGRRITDDFGVQAPTWRRGFSRTLRAWLERHAKECGIEAYSPVK